jgi:hypothetical protein
MDLVVVGSATFANTASGPQPISLELLRNGAPAGMSMSFEVPAKASVGQPFFHLIRNVPAGNQLLTLRARWDTSCLSCTSALTHQGAISMLVFQLDP